MLKYLSLMFTFSLALFGSGCGSSDEDDGGISDGSGGSGSGSTSSGVGGTGIVVTGSGGSAGGGGTAGTSNGTRDGGLVDLTEEEKDAFVSDACAGWAAEPEGGEPAVLQFVVDTSLSMSESPDGGGFGGPGGPGGNNDDESKWDITQDALRDAIAELPDSMPVGLFFYPNMPTRPSDDPVELDECVNTNEGIAVDVLTPGQRDLLNGALDAAGPDGYTPTHGAYQYALETFLEPADFPGQKFMVIITDGIPTLTIQCEGGDPQQGGGFGGGAPPVDTQPIIDEIDMARQNGIRTFLIGSPGSEDGRPWMSEAALLGATAASGCGLDGDPWWCHMDMTEATDFSAALRAGLSQIRDAILSCEYTYPEPPAGQSIDPSLINVVVTDGTGASQLVLPDDTGDCEEGWQDLGDRIVLCQGTCARVQNDPAASLQLSFGCETGVVPVPK